MGRRELTLILSANGALDTSISIADAVDPTAVPMDIVIEYEDFRNRSPAE